MPRTRSRSDSGPLAGFVRRWPRWVWDPLTDSRLTTSSEGRRLVAIDDFPSPLATDILRGFFGGGIQADRGYAPWRRPQQAPARRARLQDEPVPNSRYRQAVPWSAR